MNSLRVKISCHCQVPFGLLNIAVAVLLSAVFQQQQFALTLGNDKN